MRNICILGFIAITALFGASIRTAPADIPAPAVNTAADLKPASDQLVLQLMEARAIGDLATYDKLLLQWQKENQPFQNDKFPVIKSLTADEDPSICWADDKLVFAGGVSYNSWAAGGGIDDEAIDVDYVNGDTLRAVIASTDSTVYIYQSIDRGMSWSWWAQIVGIGAPVYEPQIINQTQGWCHFFARVGANNGDILAMNFDPSHAFTYSWVGTSADTILNYAASSDRVQWAADCWLFLAYHKAMGGEGNDNILFTRSLDHGQTWSAPVGLQFGGSGFPDLAFGTNNYLWETYEYRTSGNVAINTRRSTNEGVDWQGSITVMTDATAKTTPKIAGSHSTENNAWVVWGRQYSSTPYDWDVLWTWTQDAGATWATWDYCPGWINMHDIMPSISIFDNSGGYSAPYLSYILTADTSWNNPAIRTKYWHADSTWGPNSDEAVYNDSTPAFTGPVQCWEAPGVAAIAYVQSNGTRVWFDSWSNTGVEEGTNPIVTDNLLSPNRPNPFRNSTQFQYTVPEPGLVKIELFNTLGQKVAGLINEYKTPGTYQGSYTGSDLPKGIYFLKFHCGKSEATRKLIVE